MDAPLSGSGSRRAHFRSDVGKFRYCVGYLVAAHFRSRFRWQITVVVTQIQMVQQELEGVIEESWRGNISVVCLSIFSVLIWFLVS
ncbi:hypothetical protein SORBI_3008G003300 [Sorghum bicolor]|uniref:Uncharacterized protein n=1 Tax=Sorghum bicolor TaxID=4558 RepID=A0A1Z5R497_SORBI|nr:hypothetical protein SORBI_3008G003300 [Sorghum bicolor]